MSRPCIAVALVALAGVSLEATTLEKLELDEMIRKSTDIVRGRVISKTAAQRGSVIYTDATVSVIERMKGAESQFVKVSVPGGQIGRLRQTFPGSPDLIAGSDYVFFLWAGPSGVVQIVGLSQGLLDVKVNVSGDTVARRAAVEGPVVDSKTGKLTSGDPIETTLARLRARIRRVLGGE